MTPRHLSVIRALADLGGHRGSPEVAAALGLPSAAGLGATLLSLERGGYVLAWPERGAGRRGRRVYALTDRGRRALEDPTWA